MNVSVPIRGYNCYPPISGYNYIGDIMRAALYCRVSTADQNPANQELELRKACESQHWDVQAVYTDVISGAKSKRPALDKLMKAVMRREVDVVCAWDVSRLGRSLQHLTMLLNDIHAKDVDLYLHQQGIDTTTPSGKAMFGMLSVFAEFERQMISERVLLGLSRARAQGKRLGGPPLPPIKVAKIRALREQGLSARQVAKQTGVSHTSVLRLCA